MVRIVFLVFGIFLLVCGLVGLILPIIPQVPFFIMGILFLMAGSRRFSTFMKNTRIYRNHLDKWIRKSNFFTRILEVEE
jgi:uncharacterized membrane protein YbaN (DUF454 family)